MTKSYQAVKVEKEDGITWVILNRPEKRNAMNPQLHYDMLDVITELETDNETRVMVLTGAGQKLVCGKIKDNISGTWRIVRPSGARQLGRLRNGVGGDSSLLANRPLPWSMATASAVLLHL